MWIWSVGNQVQEAVSRVPRESWLLWFLPFLGNPSLSLWPQGLCALVPISRELEDSYNVCRHEFNHAFWTTCDSYRNYTIASYIRTLRGRWGGPEVPCWPFFGVNLTPSREGAGFSTIPRVVTSWGARPWGAAVPLVGQERILCSWN